MTVDSLVLILASGGFLLVVSVLVYQLSSDRPVRLARLGPDGVQELDVVVNGGYQPEVIVVRQGRPVRLNFVRRENGQCSEWVVFPPFGIARRLAPFATTPVEFTPKQAGEYVFSCRYNVCRGKLVVRE